MSLSPTQPTLFTAPQGTLSFSWEETLLRQLTERAQAEQIPPDEFVRRAVLVALAEPMRVGAKTGARPFQSGESYADDVTMEEWDAVRGCLDDYIPCDRKSELEVTQL